MAKDPKRRKVDETIFIYFGTGIEIINSTFPSDLEVSYVTWETKMVSGLSFGEQHLEAKKRIDTDLNLLQATEFISKNAPYFMKQKGVDYLWIFSHRFNGKMCSEVNIESFTAIMKICIEDIDITHCTEGPSHHFQLLPFIYANPFLKEKYDYYVQHYSSNWNSEKKDEIIKLRDTLTQVMDGVILKCDARQFSYGNNPDEFDMINEKVKRQRILFSLNTVPLYDNCVIDVADQFHANPLQFAENVTNLKLTTSAVYPFIFRGIPDLLCKREQITCIMPSYNNTVEHVLIETKHSSTASTLSTHKLYSLPIKLGELISQLYIIASGRAIRNFLNDGEWKMEHATATGLFYNHSHFYKCVLTLSSLVDTTPCCRIKPFSPCVVEENICHIIHSLF